MAPAAAVGAHPMADFQSLFLPVIKAPWPADYIREYEGGWA